MPATRIHHINFVVRDLPQAMERFARILALPTFEVVDHAPRGAHIARSPVGDGWIVLVCPYDSDSVPGRFLEANGEGFFLLSVGVDDFEKQLEQLSQDETLSVGSPRNGILDWRVADVGEESGTYLQLTDDTAREDGRKG